VVRIRDEGSTNGTYVKGERLNEGDERTITPGDSLRLAADCALTLEER
jgi:pSer/pThr/pTyr-binding forkhead associated (FHA) protein